MRCKRIRKKLAAYLDGELDERQKALVKRHLLECAKCRKEADLLSRISYLLKDQPRIKPTLSFEADLWKRIYSLEKEETTKKETTLYLLKWATYIILPAAVAAALIIGVFGENLGEKIASFESISLEEEYLSSIGLDSFRDFPPGSLSQAYFSLIEQTK